MPDWYSNILIITGIKEEREKFINKIKPVFIDGDNQYKKDMFGINKNDKEELKKSEKNKEIKTYTPLLHSLYPIPQSIIKEGDDAEYNWCIQNWGTKWDVLDLQIEHYEDITVLKFDSAWNPPIKWLKNIAPQWSNLSFTLKYFKTIISSEGTIKFEKGIEVN